MLDVVSFTITVACLVAAVLTAASAARGVAPTVAWLVLVEAALVVQAVLDLVGLARGHRPAEPGVHLAYLATSVLVLPAAVCLARSEEDRWSGLVVAVALLVTAVVVVRMQTTWRV